ncbi:hypothetical protein I308_102325 [Cryptococcus tetragattii IND107]|uniref:Uncharacterized protein n=1 Tax=Cryptococcus tetragattii IND107 TaxID=1296105 RepID=A0ABR3BX19_9TREE
MYPTELTARSSSVSITTLPCASRLLPPFVIPIHFLHPTIPYAVSIAPHIPCSVLHATSSSTFTYGHPSDEAGIQ